MRVPETGCSQKDQDCVADIQQNSASETAERRPITRSSRAALLTWLNEGGLGPCWVLEVAKKSLKNIGHIYL